MQVRQKNINRHKKFDKVAISIQSQKLLNTLLEENPKLAEILHKSETKTEALLGIREWVLDFLKPGETAYKYYKREIQGREALDNINWQEVAAIRILDYIDNTGREFVDLNRRGKITISHPFRLLWMAVKTGTGGGEFDFFIDMLELFRQFNGKTMRMIPDQKKVREWMERHPSGLDPEIVHIREQNRNRILNVIIKRIDSGDINNHHYQFEDGLSQEQKFLRALEWWTESRFHLQFAVREPELLNEMLDHSLESKTMEILQEAVEAGIPIFINPYYLSLLDTRVNTKYIGADLAIRDYVLYSKQLVSEFGYITAWEKEDIVEPGKPNAAGWILPSNHSLHRRYPEVAILIPDTVGRACGGLCVSCQRMYDFQNGHLNFNLNKLKPRETWPHKLQRLMDYFEEDAQLRDILITGGDAFMSSDASLKKILDEVYNMACEKIEQNKHRPDGQKYAEMLRVRLGTRLPVYLPQRITDSLIQVLKEFKEKAGAIGFKQFVIQTHVQTSMEITPEAADGIRKLLSAGWIVSNQVVFTAASARRGHIAKLRKVLNDLGVMPYYTFSVKGYKENYHNFATNARIVQEQIEEKIIGLIDHKYDERIHSFPENAENMVENIRKLREEANLPFLSSDRSVLNMPGVGKSLTYRTIGLTRKGRRILEFDHDHTRSHSPIIEKMGKVSILESKTMWAFMQQLVAMGENPEDYQGLFGYTIGETEPRQAIYEYPDYDFKVTDEMTNLEID